MRSIAFYVPGHTGDLMLAMPVISSVQEQGYDVSLCMDSRYYAPMQEHVQLPQVREDVESEWCRLRWTKGQHITDAWSVAARRLGLPHIPKYSTATGEGHYTLLQPWAADSSKCFSIDMWRGVAKTIDGPVRIGGPRQFRATADAIAKNLDHVTNICGEDSGNWGTTIKNAGRVISIDSGAAHVADYFGKKCLVLFRSTDPAVWAPAGQRHSWIRPEGVRQAVVAVKEFMNG